MSDFRTVGDCLDAGVAWWQFEDDPHGGRRLFTSAEDAQAHRDDETTDWPDEEYQR